MSCSSGKSGGSGDSQRKEAKALTGIHKIQHVVMIMQENRSFDSYFGTYPGANGIPTANGQFTVCNPDPEQNVCQAPYHDPADVNGGGSVGTEDHAKDVDGGKMDGFVINSEQAARACNVGPGLNCATTPPKDVMGYHDAREIPNYWAYADQFVLHDQMFQPVASWSLPAHNFLVSGWSAKCANADPSSCVNDIGGPLTAIEAQQYVTEAIAKGTAPAKDAWTSITYLLDKANVSWKYYVQTGDQPDCDDDEVTCPKKPQSAQTPGIWNPLPLFIDVQQDHKLGQIQSSEHFFTDAKKGTLPAVSWVIPSLDDSEHPGASVKAGQKWVTRLINQIMAGPDWDSTAIFVSWDDWGGFYDHVPPPVVDGNGYGLRVPSLLVSPYAKKGFIDHQTLSHDAYLKFIEDDFLAGARLNPATDGRPDPRPSVREDEPVLGDLSKDFDFTQTPRPPVVLSTDPKPGKASVPGG